MMSLYEEVATATFFLNSGPVTESTIINSHGKQKQEKHVF